LPRPRFPDDPLIRAGCDEKILNLRLFRAIEGSGVERDETPHVTEAMTELAKADYLLTLALERYDRGGYRLGPRSSLPAPFISILEEQRAARAMVLNALRADERPVVERAFEVANVTLSDLWREIEELRGRADRRLPGVGPDELL
jgi:hypothetical protein